MNKCSRYLEALDNNAADDSSLWQDVLMHAGRCPDCSSDMQLRTQLIEKLSEIEQPDYPCNLHERIMTAVDRSDSSSAPADDNDQGIVDILFEKFLQPLEIIVPAACIAMFIVLMQINYAPETENLKFKPTGKTQAVRIAELPPLEPGSLEHVSGEEVRDFLVRLEEFRKTHPDDTTVTTSRYLPAVELVNDR